MQAIEADDQDRTRGVGIGGGGSTGSVMAATDRTVGR
jgi:hypothetical protein